MTIIRTLVAALVVAALAVPAAQAAPIDYSKNSATGEYVAPAFPAYPTPKSKGDAAAFHKQDLRMPDTYDYAHGRGTFNSPDVAVVKVPSPAPAPSGGGVDWGDVGIGAGGALAMIALAGVGTAAAMHRRQRTAAAV